MIKKTKDKLFYCGKANQLLKILAEANQNKITLQQYLKMELNKGQSVAGGSTTP